MSLANERPDLFDMERKCPECGGGWTGRPDEPCPYCAMPEHEYDPMDALPMEDQYHA